MYGQPIRVQQFQGGFAGSRFQSMSRREQGMGAVILPPVAPFVNVAPSVIVPPSAIISPSAILPPGAFIGPPGVFFTDSSADDNKVIGILIALGLFGLGAALF